MSLSNVLNCYCLEGCISLGFLVNQGLILGLALLVRFPYLLLIIQDPGSVYAWIFFGDVRSQELWGISLSCHSQKQLYFDTTLLVYLGQNLTMLFLHLGRTEGQNP